MPAPEWRIARSAAAVVAVLSVPVLAIAWLSAGPGGLLGAAIGAAVVLGMFLLSGALMALGGRFGPTGLLAAALGGFLLRLMIYAALIVVLRPVEAIHGESLAIAAAVLLVAALAWEARAVTRQPDFFWIDASARAGEPRRTAPRRTERTPA